MNRMFRFLLYTIVGIVAIFVTMPFFAVVKKGIGFAFTFPYPEEIQFALKLSLWTSFLSSSLCTLLTIGTVYGKEQLPKTLSKSLDYLFTLPMATPHIVSGIGLLIIFGQKGIGAFLLEHFGIDFVYTVHGIWLAMLFVNLPYSIRTLDNSYSLVNKKLLFTARTLGLTEKDVFFHVLIPLLKRPIVGTWMMNWARSIGEFGAIMILVGVTRLKTETLATSIFLHMSTGEFEVAAGVSSILLLLSMGTMFIFEKWMKGDSHASNS